MPNERPLERSTYQRSLQIDEDALDECLVNQPGLFYRVAEALTLATARADTIKLRVEEKTAELDQQIRTTAADADEKITEAGIQNRLRTLPAIQTLRRDYTDAVADAEAWRALKEAYHQRSFMLRELVALKLAHFHNLGTERGLTSSRSQLGEQARQRGEEQRRDQRRNSGGGRD